MRVPRVTMRLIGSVLPFEFRNIRNIRNITYLSLLPKYFGQYDRLTKYEGLIWYRFQTETLSMYSNDDAYLLVCHHSCIL